MSKISCAFRKGKGNGAFDRLSELAICRVCDGAGKVVVKEPVIICVFCKGTGIHRFSRVTCSVCKGHGIVAVNGSVDRCPLCKGTGTTVDNGLPCNECKGKGIISKS